MRLDSRPAVTPFSVAVPDEALDELRRRLAAARWAPDWPEEGWAAGMPGETLRRLCADWAALDWRAVERRLNESPQVRVEVDGYPVHVVHQPGVGPDPLPIVVSHGWPSTFAEWRRVIGPLTDPAAHGGDPADAFTVVAPSLPGYAFSPPPGSPGTTPRRIAALFQQVLAGLGSERFGAVGCDWGAYVTALLGLDHPSSVVGAHMGLVSLSGSGHPAERDPQEEAYGERVRRWRKVEQGYIAIQGTKPQTLAAGLTDSPAGLAAWVGEKWWAWSDQDGSGEPMVPREDLLTALSLYWFTGTIGSASRLYYESARSPVRLAPGQRVEVPCGFLLERPGDDRHAGGRDTGFAAVPRTGAPPRERAERAFAVERWTEAPAGGHFPALETPELFVDEVRAFFRPLR
jgi:pimeloyl-ACP methyl ester carboxylesterase